MTARDGYKATHCLLLQNINTSLNLLTFTSWTYHFVKSSQQLTCRIQLNGDHIPAS